MEQIDKVIEHKGHFPGRERDEEEIKGYYVALAQVERWVAQGVTISEKLIQQTHALVVGGGKEGLKPSLYRDGQNVIYDGATKGIVYMPPEAKDVPLLMAGLVKWLHENKELPCPLLAAIAHYQFATIHPYYDGNGRTARLLTTFIIHTYSYDLQGIYSLEEYYARDLASYYKALSVGPSHNYYMGRAEADISGWISYFIAGMAEAFERVVDQLFSERRSDMPTRSVRDRTLLLRSLKPLQRKVLELFEAHETISADQIAQILGYTQRSAALQCKKWVAERFLEIADSSKKARRYRLASQFELLVIKQ